MQDVIEGLQDKVRQIHQSEQRTLEQQRLYLTQEHDERISHLRIAQEQVRLLLVRTNPRIVRTKVCFYDRLFKVSARTAAKRLRTCSVRETKLFWSWKGCITVMSE